MSVCPFIFLVETAGKREEGNGQLAKSVKYLSGKRHRDEAALLLSMFTSMSEWEQDLERGTYTKCCVGVTRFLSLSLYIYLSLSPSLPTLPGTLRFSALFQFSRPYCTAWTALCSIGIV